MKRVPFDNSALVGRRCYNAAISESGTMCYREGFNYDSYLVTVELDDDLRPRRDTTTFLPRRGMPFLSFEDPRWYEYGLYYVAWRRERTAVVQGTQTIDYGRLVEKNWVLFADGPETMATYSMSDGRHVVLSVNGRRAEVAYETEFEHAWQWGDMRGGTNWITDGDLSYALFHSRRDWTHGAIRFMQFFAGVVARETEPPYRIVGVSRRPLPLPVEWATGKRWRYHVVFPLSLTRWRDRLLVCAGHNDCEIRLYETSLEELRHETGLA